MSQWKLLGTRRFAALFWTQFAGAFNDNLFKNALVILIAYRAMSIGSLDATQLVPLCAGVFILPFFLFSAVAGQITDKLAKHRLMRWVKAAEIGIMSVAAIGFVTQNLSLLVLTLFLMGLQSTFFGPAKYGILPELLDDRELVGGNALVEMGTFVAILLGTIAGGLLIAVKGSGPLIVSVGVVTLAAFGWLASTRIQQTRPAAPRLAISLNPLTPTLQTYRIARSNRPVFLSILGISWFWFLGASLLTLLPNLTKDLLQGNEQVVTFFLALFCGGIAVGSLLCERLSGQRLELGLVPLGSIGMTLFTADLALALLTFVHLPPSETLYGLGDFIGRTGAWRVTLDFAMLSVFSGFYTVPLYTMVQQRSAAESRSRVIAANNILNALFMVVSSLMLIALGIAKVGTPHTIAILAGLNAAVALYIYTVLPEFLWRFVAWVVAHVMYRLRVRGREELEVKGPAVLVCNHVSFVDWLLIAAVCKRPVRFVMHHTFMRLPLLRFAFRDAKVIPIAGSREDATALDEAFDRIASELEQGEIVCIFPEGKLTDSGEMNPFRRGIEQIIRRTPVPVIPMALQGMWGSFFSRKGGRAMRRPFRRFWSRVTLTIGEPVAADAVTARELAQQVAALGGWNPPAGLSESPAVAVENAMVDCDGKLDGAVE